MHPLNDTVAVVKAVDQLAALVAVLICHTQLSLGAFFNDHFGVLVYVAVSVTGDADGLCPCRNVGSDALDEDRLTEYRTVEDRSDRTVRAFPHFFEVVLVHTRRVRGDGRALDRYAVLFRRLCGVDSDLIVCLITLFKTEIIVLAFEIDKGEDQLILQHLPDNSGHLVAVHFDERCFHLNLCHIFIPPYHSLCIEAPFPKGAVASATGGCCAVFYDAAATLRRFAPPLLCMDSVTQNKFWTESHLRKGRHIISTLCS